MLEWHAIRSAHCARTIIHIWNHNSSMYGCLCQFSIIAKNSRVLFDNLESPISRTLSHLRTGLMYDVSYNNLNDNWKGQQSAVSFPFPKMSTNVYIAVYRLCRCINELCLLCQCQRYYTVANIGNGDCLFIQNPVYSSLSRIRTFRKTNRTQMVHADICALCI